MRRLGSALLVAVAICLVGGTGATAAEASAKARKFTFGVVPQHSLTGKDFRAMERAGIESVRVTLAWPEIQPRPGAMDWSGFDQLVRQAARRHVRVMPSLYGSPAWAARYDGYRCTSDCSNYSPASEQTRAAFSFFAAEAARQYGPGGRFWAAHPRIPYRPVRSWQVWNEQNSPKYFGPAPDIDRYAQLLIVTSARIRTVDPAAEIVLGGMWGPRGATDVVPAATFLKRLYRREGARESFDSLAAHPYAAGVSGVLKQIGQVRRIANRSGDARAGIWLTELGWASNGPRRHHLVKGRRGQARILNDAYEAILERSRRWRIRGAYWYAWQDTPRDAGFICTWCPGAGLRAVNGGLKPSWRAMRELAVGGRR